MGAIEPKRGRPAPVNLFIGPAHNPFVNSIATTWPTANAARIFPFQVNRAVTVTTAYFRVVVASGNMDVGIYDAAGNRLRSTGSFAVPVAAVTCSQALSSALTLAPGVRYYAAMACDNATANFATYGITGTPDVPGFLPMGQVAASMPLPASLVIPAAQFGGFFQGIWFA